MAKSSKRTSQNLGLFFTQLALNLSLHRFARSDWAYLEAKLGNGLAVNAGLLRGSRRGKLNVLDTEVRKSGGAVYIC